MESDDPVERREGLSLKGCQRPLVHVGAGEGGRRVEGVAIVTSQAGQRSPASSHECRWSRTSGKLRRLRLGREGETVHSLVGGRWWGAPAFGQLVGRTVDFDGEWPANLDGIAGVGSPQWD